MNTYIPAEEEQILILGRTVKAAPLPLFWTASGVEFVTDAAELFFEIETDYAVHEQWIRVELDGYPLIRTALGKGKTTLCAFRGLDAAVKKRVRLIKEVQPMRIDQENRLLLCAIHMDGTLYPLPQKTYKLEFVGDSITSGEGLAGTKGTHVWAPAIFSTLGHYALRTAEMMDAELRILSQSGWGAYCSWDNDPVRSLPPYYKQVCGVLKGEENERLGAFMEHDFSSWQPDAVVVNLGSNDAFAFDNPAWVDERGNRYRMRREADGSFARESTDRFIASVTQFLKTLRACNPDSYLIWAYGMINGSMEPYIVEGVERYRSESGDMRAEYLALPPLKEEWTGANDHPGRGSHMAAAEVLSRRLAQLLSPLQADQVKECMK